MTSFGANIIEERGFNPTFKVNYFPTATHITYTNTSNKKTKHIHNVSPRLINQDFVFNFTDSRTNSPSCRSIVAASEC